MITSDQVFPIVEWWSLQEWAVHACSDISRCKL